MTDRALMDHHPSGPWEPNVPDSNRPGVMPGRHFRRGRLDTTDHPWVGDDGSPVGFVGSWVWAAGVRHERFEGEVMAIGPVEYIIVGFPGNQFNGEIAPELGRLVKNGTIRILDLVFIMKDPDGNVAAVDFEDHDDLALFAALDG